MPQSREVSILCQWLTYRYINALSEIRTVNRFDCRLRYASVNRIWGTQA
jgi:hypothetical protein